MYAMGAITDEAPTGRDVRSLPPSERQAACMAEPTRPGCMELLERREGEAPEAPTTPAWVVPVVAVALVGAVVLVWRNG